jgi:hypothetical protein
MKYSAYSFLTSALQGISGQRHGLPHLTQKKAPGTHWVRGWLGSTASLKTKTRKEIVLPLPGIETRSPGRPVRSDTLY